MEDKTSNGKQESNGGQDRHQRTRQAMKDKTGNRELQIYNQIYFDPSLHVMYKLASTAIQIWPTEIQGHVPFSDVTIKKEL